MSETAEVFAAVGAKSGEPLALAMQRLWSPRRSAAGPNLRDRRCSRLSSCDAIKAVTSRAAECIGIAKRTGSVQVGLEADLIIVGENPLVNINTLGTVLAVINDGRRVKNTFAAR